MALRMYGELAEYYPLITAPPEYAHEAAIYGQLLSESAAGTTRTVLELGSGAGANAYYLKQRFDLTLTDLSPRMLALSEALNPECEHIVGDMRDLALGRTFDAVFVHDAVCYMSSQSELRAALDTAARHLRPGGGIVVVPDYVTETFEVGTEEGGGDRADGSGLRWLAWVQPRTGETYAVDYAFLIRAPDGAVRCVHERHQESVFDKATWLRLLDDAGFDAEAQEAQLVPPTAHTVFSGRRR